MRELAQALERARETRSRLAKIAAIAEALRGAAREGPAALATATRLAMGRTLPLADGRTLGVGWRLVGGVATALTGASEAALREAMQRLGDLGDAVCELYGPAHARDPRRGVTLAELAALFEAVASTGQRATKSALLLELLSRATPLEAKYIVKALLGELRTGAVEGVVVAAIAEAFGAPLKEVRHALGLLADAADVAVLASEGRLGEARLVPGRPFAFMLATPMETIASPIEWEACAAEDKLDGVRAQVHVAAGQASVFARGFERVTHAFPEVAQGFASQADAVLDGEIVAMGVDGRVRPFQALQARLGRVAPSAELLAQVPATFVAFDLLVDGERVLVDAPWSERREALERFAGRRDSQAAFLLNPCYRVAGPEELDAAFDRARGRGQEGLVLKRRDAPYEAGRRGQAWIKVKKAFATLDVVVTAVELGHGKRAGILSDYTFAVRREEDGELVDVGKAYSGLSDAEIAENAQLFMATTREEQGWRRIVEPRLVIEVGFDGIQRSKRHPSGYALRFPRILRIRKEKGLDEVDTAATVEALFRAQVASGHREEAEAPAPARTGRGRRGKRREDRQLSLFGEEEEREKKR